MITSKLHEETTRILAAYERAIGRREQVKSSITRHTSNLRRLRRVGRFLLTSMAIAQQVARETQQDLEYHISESVSLALAAVFPEAYEFSLSFEARRGQTEADPKFIRNGEEVNPLEASGGGPVDVACMALLVALRELERPLSRNTMILDEPFKNVSEDLQEAASAMLKELSEQLNLQFFVSTHQQALIESADRVFEMKQRKEGKWWVTQTKVR